MEIQAICKSYFNGINEISQPDKKTKALAALKIITYFTLVIPLCFAITLGISHLYDRVTKKTVLTDKEKKIDDKSKNILSNGTNNIQPKAELQVDQKLPILTPESTQIRIYPGDLTEEEKANLVTEFIDNDTLKITFKPETGLKGFDITVRRQNIFETGAEAIVNAANQDLCGGGGIDGDCHSYGGTDYAKGHRGLRDLPQYKDEYVSGHAVMIGSGAINSEKFVTDNQDKNFKNTANVIVVAGPGGTEGQPPSQQDKNELYSCYYNSFLLAYSQNKASLAIPAISTGIFGFPISGVGGAAAISLRALYDFVKFVNQQGPETKLKTISFHFLASQSKEKTLDHYNIQPKK